MAYQTEYPFTLPRGYMDENGTVHREGTMRFATAADEILPLKDPRVQQNPAYLSVVLMTRVITKLGTLPAIDNRIVEKRKLSLPKRLTNVIHCKNPRCITSIEQELPHVFYLADEEHEVYRCLYCDEKHGKKRTR